MKKVEFINHNDEALYANIGTLKAKDLETTKPEVFDNDYDGHSVLSLADIIAMLFPNGDTTQKPILYIRHTDMIKNQYRFGDIVELGDNPLDVQKGVYHEDEIAQAKTSISEYHQLAGNKYGFTSENPYSELAFNEDYWTAKEGNVFSIKGDGWPKTIFEHQSMYHHVATMIRAATVSGIFEGKSYFGLGEHDRLFIPTEVNGFDGITNNFGYVYMNMMGIREDGRREQCLISLEFSGKIFAYYYIDGEEPVLTDHVIMEAEWEHLPYVDDGTCVYRNATFRFCNKVFHFNGKWGTKGFTPKPRVEKHGQSQIFGTWYEGETPYRHRVFLTFGENMEAYDHKLTELGFDVR
jgi:hypothetical protein